MRGNRSEVLEETIEGALSEKHEYSSITAEGVKFNRKRDRMSFKQYASQTKIQRQYVGEVPLLLDLSKFTVLSHSLLIFLLVIFVDEILNLDVISMAMKEQDE